MTRAPRPCKGCGSTEGHNHFDWMRDCPVWNGRITFSVLKDYLADYARNYEKRQRQDFQAAERVFNQVVARYEAGQ